MPSAEPRAWRQPRSTRATQLPKPSNFAGRARARAHPVAARRRSISRDSSRASTHPLAFLRRLHPETSRHRTREPRDHAAPSARRITTRRRLAGGVRRTGDQRPSVRGARSPPKARPLRPLATRDQYDSPATFHSTRTPPANRTHHHGRAAAQARRSTPRSTSSSTSFKPRDTNPPSTGVRPSPAGRHACGAASVSPAGAHAAGARARGRARARCPLPRLPDSVDSALAEVRCHLRWPSARANAPPRLFC